MEEEAKDWHARLDSLKKFTESLAPYNTVGKLKNLRVTQEDLDGQKKNLEILAAVERLLELVVELGSTASYLSQAEMVLPAEHPWVKQAETARKAMDIPAKFLGLQITGGSSSIPDAFDKMRLAGAAARAALVAAAAARADRVLRLTADGIAPH